MPVPESDVEKEIDNESIAIEIPFNPNDITINIIPRTIGQLVEMLEYGELLRPKYQRLPDLWDDKKKSRFIESLMLSLPIPLFYFDEGDDKKWRVIDGLQRISTLEHFILAGNDRSSTISQKTDALRLRDLEFRTEFNDKTWQDLPRAIQRRISTNQVTINLIGKGTPEQVKYNIFSRINQGGTALEAQEIRTALFQGYRIEFLEELVSDETPYGQVFRGATNGSISNRRQQDLDFVTRFATFFLIDYSEYEPDMDSFLTKGTSKIPNNLSSQKKMMQAFKQSMELSQELFGGNAFRKWAEPNERRKPVNKSLFEITSVKFAKLDESQKKRLVLHKDEFLKEYKALFADETFVTSITASTAARERVRLRNVTFEKLVDKFA